MCALGSIAIIARKPRSYETGSMIKGNSLLQKEAIDFAVAVIIWPMLCKKSNHVSRDDAHTSTFVALDSKSSLEILGERWSHFIVRAAVVLSLDGHWKSGAGCDCAIIFWIEIIGCLTASCQCDENRERQWPLAEWAYLNHDSSIEEK
jgi:hypothetical protein